MSKCTRCDACQRIFEGEMSRSCEVKDSLVPTGSKLRWEATIDLCSECLRKHLLGMVEDLVKQAVNTRREQLADESL